MLGFTPLAVIPLAVATSIQSILAELTDAATASDSAPVAVANFTPAYSDTVTAADEFSVASSVFGAELLEAGAVQDSFAALIGYVCALDETVTAQDVEAVLVDFYTSFSDFGDVIDDSLSAQLDWAVLLAESGVVSDQFAGGLVYVCALSELAAGTATASSLVDFVSVLTESITASDSLSSNVGYNASFSALATGTDSVSVSPSVFNAALAVSAAVVDQFLAAAVFTANIQGSAVGADTIVARYLWELIDDSQTADWSTINDAQSPGWTTINDAQPNTWVTIGTDN